MNGLIIQVELFTTTIGRRRTRQHGGCQHQGTHRAYQTLSTLSKRAEWLLASLAGHFPIDGAATYSSTKVALRYFTFALAEELRATGVSVSAVSPGPIQTGFIMEHLDEVADITFSQTMTTPEHVAEMVLQCARDGQAERVYPQNGARLAILSTLFPALRRWVKPLLERKGRKVKEALRRVA